MLRERLVFGKLKNGTFLVMLRYIFASIFGFVFVTTLTQFGSQASEIHPKYFFGVSLAMVTTFDYLLNLKYVFREKHKSVNILYYVGYLFLSWISAVLLFSVLLQVFVSVVISNLLTSLCLFPIRFLAAKLIFSGRN